MQTATLYARLHRPYYGGGNNVNFYRTEAAAKNGSYSFSVCTSGFSQMFGFKPKAGVTYEVRAVVKLTDEQRAEVATETRRLAKRRLKAAQKRREKALAEIEEINATIASLEGI